MNNNDKWNFNEIFQGEFEDCIEVSCDGDFSTPIEHLNFKKEKIMI